MLNYNKCPCKEKMKKKRNFDCKKFIKKGNMTRVSFSSFQSGRQNGSKVHRMIILLNRNTATVYASQAFYFIRNILSDRQTNI